MFQGGFVMQPDMMGVSIYYFLIMSHEIIFVIWVFVTI